MPFVTCTLCGTQTHLSVTDIDSWFATQYPGLPREPNMPGLCFHCFVPLQPGDKLVTRRFHTEQFSIHGAQAASLVSVIGGGAHGDLFEIKLADSTIRIVPRAAIRKA